MSAQPATSQESDQVAETSDSPGRRLRLTRQARGLEIDHVASQLHLAPDQISALERDDYDALPGPVFVIGYTRNYARLVGLDPEPLLDAYRATSPEARRPRSRSRPAGSKQIRSNHLLVRVVSIAILVAAAGLAFLWWQKEYGGGQHQAPPRDENAVDEGSAPIDADPFLPEFQDSPPAAAPVDRQSAPNVALPTVGESPPPRVEEESLAEPRPAAPEAQRVDPAETAATSVPPEGTPEEAAAHGGETETSATAQGDIVMSFSGPCWVDIRDSTRKFKLFGEMSKGDRHVLEGTPPYSVILGNAAAVQITVAGKSLDIEEIARGNVARFTLDPKQIP